MKRQRGNVSPHTPKSKAQGALRLSWCIRRVFPLGAFLPAEAPGECANTAHTAVSTSAAVGNPDFSIGTFSVAKENQE